MAVQKMCSIEYPSRWCSREHSMPSSLVLEEIRWPEGGGNFLLLSPPHTLPRVGIEFELTTRTEFTGVESGLDGHLDGRTMLLVEEDEDVVRIRGTLEASAGFGRDACSVSSSSSSSFSSFSSFRRSISLSMWVNSVLDYARARMHARDFQNEVSPKLEARLVLRQRERERGGKEGH